MFTLQYLKFYPSIFIFFELLLFTCLQPGLLFMQHGVILCSLQTQTDQLLTLTVGTQALARCVGHTHNCTKRTIVKISTVSESSARKLGRQVK